MVPSYVAVRSRKALLIRYRVGESGRHAWEYYRYHPRARHGMVERANTYVRDKDTVRVRNIKTALRKFDDCTGRVCRVARHLRGGS